MVACLIPSVDMTAQAAPSSYELVSYARQYIGYPYKLGATGPKSFDCAGFVSYVFKHFGVDLPKNASAYFNNPTKYGTLVGKGSIDNAQMGDVIAWQGHVAIYTENGYCVEALGTDYGVCESVRVNRHSNGMNYKVIRIDGIASVATPKISSLSGSASGVNIKWGKVTNAEKYKVFRKTGNGKWVGIGTTTSTEFVDKNVVSGTTYVYTVRCISSDGKIYTSSYDANGKSIQYLSAPKLSSVSNTASGIKIKWDKVSGAAKYRVFFKTGSGSWTKIADTTSTNYTWTSAKSGQSYKFTVRCVSSDGKTYTSGYDSAGLSLNYIAVPKLSSVFADNSGTVIKWDKVAGAENYRVFYKTASGELTKIADTVGTSYTWTGAKYGTEYTYTVRCLSKDGKSYTSDYDHTGKSLKSVAAPKLKSVSVDNSGTVIKWDKVSGAEKYRVYYKTGSGNWTKIADTTSTAYTWTGAKSDTSYSFTVRCIAGDGKSYASGFDKNGISITFFSAPVMTSVYTDGSKTVINWDKVKGAEKYRVFCKTGSGGWTKVADTTSTSYTLAGAKIGTTFTVCCISSDGKKYTSGYNSKGLKVLATPTITSLSKTEKDITISWGKVSGAEKYRVFYKANGESTWHKVGDTTSASYTWKGAKKGTKYTFTVRCISNDGKSYMSSYDSKGKSITK